MPAVAGRLGLAGGPFPCPAGTPCRSHAMLVRLWCPVVSVSLLFSFFLNPYATLSFSLCFSERAGIRVPKA